MKKVPELLRIASQKGSVASWEDLAEEFYYQEVSDRKERVEALMELESILAQTREKYLAEITNELMLNKPVAGFKLQAGRKTRSIKDMDKAEKMLKDWGVDRQAIYKETFIGIPALEKILIPLYSKDRTEELLSEFVTMTEGKPKAAFK